MEKQKKQAAKRNWASAAASDLHRLSTTGKNFLLDPDSRTSIIEELQMRLKVEQQKRCDLLSRSSSNILPTTSIFTTEAAQLQQKDSKSGQLTGAFTASAPSPEEDLFETSISDQNLAPRHLSLSKSAKELATAPISNDTSDENLAPLATALVHDASKLVELDTITKPILEKEVRADDAAAFKSDQPANSSDKEGRKPNKKIADAFRLHEGRIVIDKQSLRPDILVASEPVSASEKTAPSAPLSVPNQAIRLTIEHPIQIAYKRSAEPGFLKAAEKEASRRSIMQSTETPAPDTPMSHDQYLRGANFLSKQPQNFAPEPHLAPGGGVQNYMSLPLQFAPAPALITQRAALSCLQCLMRSLQESGLLGSCWITAIVDLEEAFAIKHLADAATGGKSPQRMSLPVIPSNGVLSSGENFPPASQVDVSKWKALERLCFLRNSLQTCSHQSA